ncbi:MAG: hypothetical protein H7263_16790 [Candidatus Sericytochromatia bacterium]|nr:hypothetical protein [Candidatus Sericytochromatia bacterium]
MIKKQKKSTKILFLLSLALLNISCSLSTNQDMVKPANINKDVDFKNGFKIQLKINNLDFNTKASSSGKAPSQLNDVKSYSAFLTTNYNDPFATGANPNGDGVIAQANSATNGSASIVFNNVRRGGAYFAVIATFEDIVGGNNRNNITFLDNTILSADKRWSRSTNSVTILPSGTLSFSDSGTELKSNLSLSEGLPVKIGFQVNVLDGSSIAGPIGSSAS